MTDIDRIELARPFAIDILTIQGGNYKFVLSKRKDWVTAIIRAKASAKPPKAQPSQSSAPPLPVANSPQAVVTLPPAASAPAPAISPQRVTAACPQCGASGEVPISAVGKSIKCNGCGATFAVAPPSATTADPARRPTSVKPFLWTITGMIALLLVAMTVSGCGKPHAESDEAMLSEVSGTWSIDGFDSSVSIDLASKSGKHLNSSGKQYPFAADGTQEDHAGTATIKEIDRGNDRLVVSVSTREGTTHLWTFRQLWDEDGKRFTLYGTEDGGTEWKLDYIGNW